MPVRRQHLCGKCGQPGHNRRSCQADDPPTPVDLQPPGCPPPPPPPRLELVPRQVEPPRGRVSRPGGYFADIRAESLMPRDEEQRVAAEWRRTGNLALRDRLVRANVRLVVSIARRMRRRGLPLEDLIQEGNLGLLRAVETFDGTRGIKLGSYASWWIQHFIRRYIDDIGNVVRVPSNKRQNLTTMVKARAAMERTCASPSIEQIAQAMDSTPARVRTILAVELTLKGGVSLESKDPAGIPLLEHLAGRNEDRPDVAGERAELLALLRYKVDAFASTLDYRLRLILRDRLLSDETTLESIGQRLNITRERVRQIETRLKADLREWLIDQMDLESLVA